MVAVLCVGLGGFIGSVGRYLLGLVPVEGDFPLMTFAVNFAGAVLIGAVFEAATEGSGLPDNAVLFLKTGVCGGFTTFSAFSLETLALLERGKYATGALYACGSVLACLAGVVIGRLAVGGGGAAPAGAGAAGGGAGAAHGAHPYVLRFRARRAGRAISRGSRCPDRWTCSGSGSPCTGCRSARRRSAPRLSREVFQPRAGTSSRGTAASWLRRRS